MDTETQQSKAVAFHDLHGGPDPLVLPCAWDAASARLFEAVGFPAVGTSSAGVANALGYADGQRAPFEAVRAATERIADSVSIPVSADLEAGYGDTVDEVVDNVRAAVEAGVVGVNLEDGSWPGADPLVDRSVLVETIEGVRDLAEDLDVPVVVNARTDVFLHAVGPESTRFDRAAARANTYRAAGADCLFVPGVSDPETIGELVSAIDGPLNVLASRPEAASVPELGRLGVRRVSVGPGPMYAAMGAVRRMGEQLLGSGTYAFDGAVPYPEMQALFDRNG